MSQVTSILLDILKITIPALIVFATVYYILKKFFNAQLLNQQMQINKDHHQHSQKIKLQAYERLTLFCERIDISNLLMRLRMSSMTNQDLYQSLMISIQKEYEHNIVQQIYVSESLWSIILMAKSNILNIIDSANATVSPAGNASELSDAIYSSLKELQKNPIRTALNAINKEAKTLI